ncbi:hypothetical protein I6G82_06675 [Lysinibacillus macroides]|uniref:hypothetical protein n=1 Tax=Lysinibacillus macroides TaxID=33935 RepID=UPI001935F140|nr:hypothetical protein I6G82_06675 [Lysinibacillus macroides]
MNKKYEPFEHPRWRDNPVFEVVGEFPLTEEQKKRKEQSDKEVAEFLKNRKKNKKA